MCTMCVSPRLTSLNTDPQDQISLISGQGRSNITQCDALSEREDRDPEAGLWTATYFICLVLILQTGCLHFRPHKYSSKKLFQDTSPICASLVIYEAYTCSTRPVATHTHTHKVKHRETEGTYKLKVDGRSKVFWREEDDVDKLEERGKPGRVQKTSTASGLSTASPASWFHQDGSRGWRGWGCAQARHKSPLQASCLVPFLPLYRGGLVLMPAGPGEPLRVLE